MLVLRNSCTDLYLFWFTKESCRGDQAGSLGHKYSGAGLCEGVGEVHHRLPLRIDLQGSENHVELLGHQRRHQPVPLSILQHMSMNFSKLLR